jgi:hypothetical protein
MIKNNPAALAINYGSILAGLVAWHYGAIATDPEVAKAHAAKSPQQKATSVIGFGGAELPLDPLVRFLFAAPMTILDHATGAHDGNFDKGFLDHINTFFDDDVSMESLEHDMSNNMWETFKQNNPFDPMAIPIVGSALAYAGVDTGMTRMSGETTPVREQNISGMGGDGKLTDSMMSAYWQNLIQSVGGTFFRSMAEITNDMYRAWGEDAPFDKKVQQGYDRWKDTQAKGAGLATPLLFGDYEKVKAVGDTNWQMMRDKQEGIDKALKVFDVDLRAEGSTGLGMRTALPMPEEEGVIKPEYQGTQVEVIGSYAKALRKEISVEVGILSALGKQTEKIRNEYLTSPEKKNKKVNDLAEKRKALTLYVLTRTRAYEDLIGQAVGNPDFSFDEYNPQDYAQPMQPQN